MEHPHLALLVALATALTIFIISASYNTIIELFPTGGGGYLVASKLLNPDHGHDLRRAPCSSTTS